MLCDLSPPFPVPAAGGFTHLSLSRNTVIALGRTGLPHHELTHGLGGTFHEKHVCPPEIIALLVQEGTRNCLQTAPKQTPRPQFPPAPAWLFSLSPTSLLLALGQGMKAGKGGPGSFQGEGAAHHLQLCAAQRYPEQGGRCCRGHSGGKVPLIVPARPSRSAQQQRKGFFTVLFSSLSQRLTTGPTSVLFAFLPQHRGMCELDELSKNDLMQRRIRK